MLVNPRDAGNRPCRKPSATPRGWPISARMGCCGPRWFRRHRSGGLRDLTRARTDLNRDRVRQIHRLEKVLEDAGIKLSSVATDIMASRAGPCWRR